MKRRDFITLVGGAVSLPLAARAQQAMPVIGYLSSGSPGGFATRLAAFRQGLQETGFREGQNVAIEYRWAEGQSDRLAAMAAELVRRQVNVLATPGGLSAASAARSATATIPIVFETGADPVAAGLVTSLSRPTTNITGVTSLNVEVGPKRLELLHQLAPAATALALLVNPTNPNSPPVINETRNAARALKLDLHILEARSDGEFEGAFAKFTELKAGGMVVGPDPFYIDRNERLAALTVRHGVIAIFHTREFVAARGLLSYGDSLNDAHRRIGLYAGRILKGDKAGDLPVWVPTKFEFVLNLKTAKTLGVAIPASLLAIADEVIE